MRPVLAVVLLFAWLAGLGTLGVAWAQDTVVLPVSPGGGEGLIVNMGDLTFPGAVLAGFWLLAQALPKALAAWTPTIRLELVHRDERDGDSP